ncbi:MAG: DUF1015 domain-containing protein [Flavobacteriales bacterium]|nr:DUF1015 domain-containing protein [Flavobacteriales bacterium]
MIDLRPFRAWRPSPDKAHLVGSRSYISYSKEELADKLAGNPYTFLHVIHPEEISHHPGSRMDRFHRIRNAFKGFCDEGFLERDAAPCIYVYEQRSRGILSRGIIAGVNIAAYRDGRIKVHEQTLTARENLFSEYLAHTGINAEPVLLSTPEGSDWQRLLEPIAATRPDQDFSTTDRVRHRLWAVMDDLVRVQLQEAFARIPALYIADGHHRLASSARLAESSGAGDVDPQAWCLAFIVPKPDLHIYNFDRAITTLGWTKEDEFLDGLASVGSVRKEEGPVSAPGVIGVRTRTGWHSVTLPPSDALEPSARLDAARLSELILGPLLRITDLRSDPRVKFVPGADGPQVLERMVTTGQAEAAFHLYPVSFEELQAVADVGGTMPPKSTYIEPKLRSGLVVYSLEDV